VKSTAAARLPRQERREHLLDVAADLVLQRGVRAVTMEAVAAAAGVSKGLGYAYFPNRGALLVALYDREMHDLEQRATAGITAATAFEHQIRAAVGAWFDLVAERGALLGALLASASIKQALEARGSGGQRQLEAFYGRLIEREFTISKDEAIAAAAVFVAGIAGVLERWGARRGEREVLEETYIRLVMGGLRALASERSVVLTSDRTGA
jgi:AcrR family transcriptional regulator